MVKHGTLFFPSSVTMMQHKIERSWQRALRYFSERNLDAAKASCESVLATQPSYAQANWMLASILLYTGKIRLASHHAAKAGDNISNLGILETLKITWILITTGQTGRAKSILDTLDIDHSNAFAGLLEMARQLALLDEHSRAQACLKKLAAGGIMTPIASHMRGTLYSFSGASELAAEAFEEAIRQAPNFALAHWSLAQLGLKDGAGQRIGRLRSILKCSGLSPEDTANIYYALFKELDDIDDTRSAWQALESGFRIRNSITDYDPIAETRAFDRIIQETSNEFLDDCHDVINSGKRPIFIVGMPRTGTTLLERILGNHPDVAVCGELNDFRQQYEWATNNGTEGMMSIPVAPRMSEIDAAELGQRYLSSVGWRTGGKLFFSDKNPGNFLFSGLILKALPESKIIHIKREPMDACFGNLKMLFAPQTYPYSYSFAGLANHYFNYSRLMSHWDEIAPQRILTISYEDLVTDPGRYSQQIFDYCGLSALDGAIDISANRRWVTTASRNQVREPIHRKNVGGWKRYATQLEPMKEILSKTVPF